RRGRRGGVGGPLPDGRRGRGRTVVLVPLGERELEQRRVGGRVDAAVVQQVAPVVVLADDEQPGPLERGVDGGVVVARAGEEHPGSAVLRQRVGLGEQRLEQLRGAVRRQRGGRGDHGEGLRPGQPGRPGSAQRGDPPEQRPHPVVGRDGGGERVVGDGGAAPPFHLRAQLPDLRQHVAGG